MKRILHRDKPKAEIIEKMTRATFKETDCDEVIVEMLPNTDTRSGKQNKLYFMWIDCLVKDGETGNSKDAFHRYFATEFLDTVVEEVNGRTVVWCPTTKTLPVGVFKKYLDDINDFAGSIGCILPKPEDLYASAMGYDRIGKEN